MHVCDQFYDDYSYSISFKDKNVYKPVLTAISTFAPASSKSCTHPLWPFSDALWRYNDKP